MRLDYRENKDAPFGMVIDMDTGLPVGRVCFFDTQTGEWERYVVVDGQFVVMDGEVMTEKGSGRIMFVPRGKAGLN